MGTPPRAPAANTRRPERADPGAPLFRKLFSASEDKARSLAIALHHLLSHLGPEDVRGLDEALRQVSFYETDYPDDLARARVRARLRSWLDASFRSFSASPSAAQVRALREAVRTARNLDPELARQLDHQLRAYEP
ncbi:hypothetical protein [Archangium violaceum]|uniref:Uncharacterized protein n=1 Tax=Archangium violaceum Cb vi76 TaxID=1406225 RepID=A0A084SZS3_9BACT|nr:hypothetical protein [Archangium violaceum]KFA93958.1 hypothetical protein Q664_05835 [Archangium violaceum Cb vi76]